MTAFTELDGVGPARADSLEDAGYDEAEDLAGVDYEELAEEIDVPEDTALEFVVQGENLAEEDESQPAPEAAESDSEEDDGEDGPLPGELAEPDTVETEASQSEEETEPEDEIAESYELVVDLESDIHYDVYMTALLNAYERRHGSHQPTLNAIESVLDDARYNSGEVTHLVTEFEINTLHAAISQQTTDYKGQNMIDHMDASDDLLSQINAVREAELL